jgi:hypothetical protein
VEYCLNTPAILQSTETPHSPIIDTVKENDMKVVVDSDNQVETRYCVTDHVSNYPKHWYS